ncbi:MAG: hypothetical protein NZM38_02165 [Cytophagales bacterium]|nr:hypothetical protein [Cytophagales bacterium]MDW8383557.1 triple tyrosine motif-containing protein [Flammeovirgaceae bacterium]
MKHQIFLLFPILSLSNLFAQTGDFYLTHYTPSISNFDNNISAIAQDISGQMCFAHRQGVLKFDGKSWHLNATPSSVLSMAYEEATAKLYVGCRYGIGYISTSLNQKEEYTKISDEISNAKQTLLVGEFAFFLHENGITQVSLKNQQVLQQFNRTPQQNFRTIFAHKTTLFAQDINGKWFSLQNQSFQELSKPFTTSLIAFAKRTPNQEKTLIGTIDGKLFLFDGTSLNPVKTEADNYLAESGLKNLFPIDHQIVAIGTARGGCVILNFMTQKVIGYINYNTGLPDDEVLAIGVDKSKGIWIAHEFGLTRVDYELPIRSFSNFPGLHGNLYTFSKFQNKIYVGTTEGVYVLSEIKDYTEVRKFVEQRKAQQLEQLREASSKSPSFTKEELATSQVEVSSNVPKRNFWNLLFGRKKEENSQPSLDKKQIREAKRKERREKRKKKNKENSEESEEETTKQTQQESPTPSPLLNSSTTSSPKTSLPSPSSKPSTPQLVSDVVLKSISYAFQKIKEIEGKCTQLLEFENQLIAVTNKGVYFIQGNRASKIASHLVIYAYITSQKELWLSTFDEKVYIYQYKQNKWQLFQVIDNVEDYINTILEDKHGSVWLSGTDILKKCTLIENKWTISAELEIYNPFGDEISLLNYDNKLYAFLSKKAYYYDLTSDSMMLDSLLSQKLERSLKFIASQPNIYWVQEQRDWHVFSSLPQINTSVYLRLFKNVNQLFVTEKNTQIWIISEHQKLYQLDLSQKATYKHEYDVFLREVKTSAGGNFLNIQQLNFDYQHNTVTFLFSIPDFIDDRSTEFQYRLLGLTNNWSEWSVDHASVTFNYLPAGDYQLEVRARNAIGQIFDCNPIQFKVNPPYWKEPWFYALEVIFFSSLLLISFKLNRSNSVNRFISKALTYLTLILVVDFLNLIISSYLEFDETPVVVFATQCAISLMIFPLEKILEKFITKSKQPMNNY